MELKFIFNNVQIKDLHFETKSGKSRQVELIVNPEFSFTIPKTPETHEIYILCKCTIKDTEEDVLDFSFTAGANCLIPDTIDISETEQFKNILQNDCVSAYLNVLSEKIKIITETMGYNPIVLA